jgi:hypothetical protein
MPELVACPVCGCKVQMAEAMLGKQVRCLTCQASFLATAEPAAPLMGTEAVRRPARPVPGAEARPPFCPGCGRAVAWENLACPHCGEEFEPEAPPGLAQRQVLAHRDADSHRGPLLRTLGNICLAAGGLSICLFGLGILVSLPLGIVTWVLANNDLGRMRSGAMDPSGREATESGRTGAILGIVLGIIFAAGYAFWWVLRW